MKVDVVVVADVVVVVVVVVGGDGETRIRSDKPKSEVVVLDTNPENVRLAKEWDMAKNLQLVDSCHLTTGIIGIGIGTDPRTRIEVVVGEEYCTLAEHIRFDEMASDTEYQVGWKDFLNGT